jgi:hypothetical protein
LRYDDGHGAPVEGPLLTARCRRGRVIPPGRGRNPTVRADLAAAVVKGTLHEDPPGDEPQWSTRLMVQRFGAARATLTSLTNSAMHH